MPEDSAKAGGIWFSTGKLYLRHSRKRQLLRFIAWHRERDELLFKEVDEKWHKAAKNAIAIDRAKALASAKHGHFEEVDECVRRWFMYLTDERLQAENPQWFEDSRADFKTIEPLVAPHRLAQTYSPATGWQVIRAHVESLWGQLSEKEAATRVQQLRRLLHRYAWFGLNDNALLNLEADKGKTSELFVFTQEKRGPKNAAVQAGRGEQYEGRPTKARDVHLVEQALRLFFVGRDRNYRATYDDMREHLCVQATRTPDGQEVVYPISLGKVMSFDQFYRIARKLVTAFALDAAKEAAADRKEMLERSGYSTDLAPRAADVYDTDTTEFNRQAVAAFEIDGEVPNLGKITFVLVVDRKSGKFVGWHVYVGNENWDEGYRLALFCALTSKTRQLEWLGIHEPDAFPDDENIAPHFIYVDGGPGSSDAAYAASSRLNIDRAIGGPATPYWKPNVEGGIGILEHSQAHLSGGYRRTSRARDRQAKRNAKLFASATPYAIEQQLVKDLIRQNRARNKAHLLDHEMKKAGIEPSSNAIFSWYVNKMGGVEDRRFSEAEVYLALLNQKPRVRVTHDGIWLLNVRYNSDRLRAYRRAMPGPLYVAILYHPLRPDEAYWLTLDGAIDSLERDKRGKEANGTMSAREIELYNARILASGIVAERKKKRKKGVAVTKEQARIALKQAASPLTKQRNAPTENVHHVRKVQAHRYRKERPLDQPDLHLPPGQRGAQAAKAAASPSRASSPAPAPAPHPPPVAPGRASTAELWRQRRRGSDPE
ncbi:hypothetical protein PE066_08670 [Ramlibacter tataouinensis]|uniref:hypothetical protein n=1 Tax=Ramlibacter tataouinensis TaxID=94132 RepID=UPI0022F404F2|nr:hypothetical protein [Ramlibacter tataouinensis]WBY03587.1 hypothetical protein PE066_08670 [Ramlibacter tataouinensis]